MTVKDLIECLKLMPEQAIVCYQAEYGDIEIELVLKDQNCHYVVLCPDRSE